MAIAAVNYSLGNQDYYPLAQWTAERNGAFYSYCWDFTVVNIGGKKTVESGLLWQGRTIDQVHQCPSYKGSDNWAGVPFTGYNYNTSYIGHGQGENVSKPQYSGLVIPNPDYTYYDIVMPIKTAFVKRPGECAIFGDGHYANGANKFMRSPWIWVGDGDYLIRKGGTQGYRHCKMTNVAWCDGHASSQRGLYTESYDSVKRDVERYNTIGSDCRIGFLSPDNSLYDIE